MCGARRSLSMLETRQRGVETWSVSLLCVRRQGEKGLHQSPPPRARIHPPGQRGLNQLVCALCRRQRVVVATQILLASGAQGCRVLPCRRRARVDQQKCDGAASDSLVLVLFAARHGTARPCQSACTSGKKEACSCFFTACRLLCSGDAGLGEGGATCTSEATGGGSVRAAQSVQENADRATTKNGVRKRGGV